MVKAAPLTAPLTPRLSRSSPRGASFATAGVILEDNADDEGLAKSKDKIGRDKKKSKGLKTRDSSGQGVSLSSASCDSSLLPSPRGRVKGASKRSIEFAQAITNL